MGNFHVWLFLYTFAIRKEVINSKIKKVNLASNKGHILERRDVISDINGGKNLKGENAQCLF